MIRSGLFRVATVLILPLLAFYKVTAHFVGSDASVEFFSQVVAMLPGRFGVVVRSAFFSRVLSECDQTVFIGFGSLLSKADTRLGKHVYIGPYCQLGWVSIGADTLLGPCVQIPSGPKAHTFDRLDVPIRNQPRESHQVVIGRDCWIGAASIVMADVGDQSVIGAGSVVTRPIGPRLLAAGVPCKTIRSRL
jgi:virginiamycin A acetyltransferase